MAKDSTTPTCNLTAILKAGRHVTRLYNNMMSVEGIRGTQYSILLFLAQHQNISIGELADGLVMERTSILRTIKPLERDGFVKVSISDKDKRVRLVDLTPAGWEKVAQAKQSWEEAQARFESEFGKEQAHAMRDMMSSVTKIHF